MRITRVTEAAAVFTAAALFDSPPLPEATERFLASPGHHLLLAHDGDGGGDGDEPVGMATAVELTHPDKGTELFVYELGVAERARRRGVATELVAALLALAAERGCHSTWVVTEPGNTAACATYRKLRPDDEDRVTLFAWEHQRP